MSAPSFFDIVNAPEEATLFTKASYAASWLKDLVTRNGGDMKGSSSDPTSLGSDPIEADLDTANLVTSRFKGRGIETHALLLDLDVPHTYIPSSTEGHGHLLIDVQLGKRQWENVMRQLATNGIIEQGYASASIAKGYAALRLPWVKKP